MESLLLNVFVISPLKQCSLSKFHCSQNFVLVVYRKQSRNVPAPEIKIRTKEIIIMITINGKIAIVLQRT